MKRNYYRMIAFDLILVVLTFFILSGCDRYARYKVLTVFFTGVPHPDENIEGSIKGTTKPGTVRERNKKKKSSRSTHGPYASKRCYLCHDTKATSAIVTSDVNQPVNTQGSQRFDAGLPGRLLYPIRKLCVQCHPSKSRKLAFKANLWIHGPVSDGMCIICHNPHASQYRFLLREGNSDQMCSKCHTEGFIVPTADHLKGEECTNCHNAHLGKTRFLLKEDFTEIY